jgi:hypothetical protein
MTNIFSKLTYFKQNSDLKNPLNVQIYGELTLFYKMALIKSWCPEESITKYHGHPQDFDYSKQRHWPKQRTTRKNN